MIHIRLLSLLSQLGIKGELKTLLGGGGGAIPGRTEATGRVTMTGTNRGSPTPSVRRWDTEVDRGAAPKWGSGAARGSHGPRHAAAAHV